MSLAVEKQGMLDEPLTIAGREFPSRLIVGTGKYKDNKTMIEAITASGAEMVTVAVRRVDLDRTKEEGVLYHLGDEKWFLLPNTAGCYTAEDAIRYARLGRAAGFTDWVKLEVIGDEETLLPDVSSLLEAARALVADNFEVLAYTTIDSLCRKGSGTMSSTIKPRRTIYRPHIGRRKPCTNATRTG